MARRDEDDCNDCPEATDYLLGHAECAECRVCNPGPEDYEEVEDE